MFPTLRISKTAVFLLSICLVLAAANAAGLSSDEFKAKDISTAVGVLGGAGIATSNLAVFTHPIASAAVNATWASQYGHGNHWGWQGNHGHRYYPNHGHFYNHRPYHGHYYNHYPYYAPRHYYAPYGYWRSYPGYWPYYNDYGRFRIYFSF